MGVPGAPASQRPALRPRGAGADSQSVALDARALPVRSTRWQCRATPW
jgi:hypothetical protein